MYGCFIKRVPAFITLGSGIITQMPAFIIQIPAVITPLPEL